MKRTFLLLLAIFPILLSAQATSNGSTMQPHLYLTPFTGPSANFLQARQELIPNAGFSDMLSPRRNFGTWNTGLNLEIALESHLSLSVEASYGIEGYQFTFQTISNDLPLRDTTVGNLRFEMQTLRLPIFFHATFGQKVQWEAFAGPYLNLRSRYRAWGQIDGNSVETDDLFALRASYNTLQPTARIGMAAGIGARIPLGLGALRLRVRGGRDLTTTFTWPAGGVAWLGADVGYSIRLW